MLLECSVTIVDPLKRNYNLKNIGLQAKYTWKIDDNKKMTVSFNYPWIFLQGPNGILKKLNNLGMLDGSTNEPFKILSKEAYEKETCSIM